MSRLPRILLSLALLLPVAGQAVAASTEEERARNSRAIPVRLRAAERVREAAL